MQTEKNASLPVMTKEHAGLIAAERRSQAEDFAYRARYAATRQRLAEESRRRPQALTSERCHTPSP